MSDITLLQILNAAEPLTTLASLRFLSIQEAIAIKRLQQALKADIEVINEIRHKIRQQLDMPERIDPNSPLTEIFLTVLSTELGGQNAEFVLTDPITIPIDQIPRGERGLSSLDMQLLEPFVVFV